MAKLPEKVGKYKILSLIGKGGMGLVYEAEHPTLKRRVILKKLTIRDKEFRERFRLEADTMMDLRSDYIVDLYDHFREGSSWYIAMEFIEGISLDELIQQKRQLDLGQFFYIMGCTAKALEYIHRRGITHRDIKPSNIYISRKGEVKLGDFGIASSSTRDVKITDSGSAMGTPPYMAPEQFDDSSSVDSKADIFSLGVTFYEALTGVKPFCSQDYTDLKHEVKKGKYRKPSSLRKKTPLFMRWMIRRCLFVRPALRYRNMNSIVKRFERELKKFGAEKVKSGLAAFVEPDKKKKKTNLTDIHKGDKPKKKFNTYKFPLILVLVFSVVFFIYIGGIQKFMLSGTYGGLKLTMVPAAEDGNYTIYSLEKNSDRIVDQGRFSRKGLAGLYLKEGSYRIKIESGSHVSWRSVYVPDFKDSGRKKTDLTILSSPLESFPLELSYTVKNRFTSEDIKAHCQLYILREGSWLKMADRDLSQLKTGTDISIKFSSEGYDDSSYLVSTAFYQTTVSLDVLLSPRAAWFVLPSLEKGLVKINGRDEYFSLESLRFEKLNIQNRQDTPLALIPGKYTVILETADGAVKKVFQMESGTEYYLDPE